MPFYDVECTACAKQLVVLEGITIGEGDYALSECCGAPVKKLVSKPHGHTMPVESPLRYQAWFNSEKTQARLRLPDSHPDRLEIPSRSSDIFHQ